MIKRRAFTDEEIEIVKDTRLVLEDVQTTLCKCFPNNRERAIAITKLDEAILWLGASMANKD